MKRKWKVRSGDKHRKENEHKIKHTCLWNNFKYETSLSTWKSSINFILNCVSFHMRERKEMTSFCSCLLHFLLSRPWLWVLQYKPVNRAGLITVKAWVLVSDFLGLKIQSVTFHLCVEWLNLGLRFPSLKWRKLIPAIEGFDENYMKSCMWVTGTCLVPSEG